MKVAFLQQMVDACGLPDVSWKAVRCLVNLTRGENPDKQRSDLRRSSLPGLLIKSQVTRLKSQSTTWSPGAA